MASYREWTGAFQQACSAPERVRSLACPNCGAAELRLVFTFYRSPGRATAVFWCGRCLEGMPPGPSEVPAGCVPVRHEDAGVPDYRVAPDTGRC